MGICTVWDITEHDGDGAKMVCHGQPETAWEFIVDAEETGRKVRVWEAIGCQVAQPPKQHNWYYVTNCAGIKYMIVESIGVDYENSLIKLKEFGCTIHDSGKAECINAVQVEKPCRHCPRRAMNDIGAKVCYLCGGLDP